MSKTKAKKDKMIQDVQALANKLGRTPTKKEFAQGKIAEYHFGTWNNFLLSAGLEPVMVQDKFINMSDDELLEIVKEEITRIGSTLYDVYNKNRTSQAPSRSYLEKRLNLTWTQILKKMGFKPNVKRLTRKELIKQLQDLADKLGKSPTIMEARSAGLNISVYDVAFGNFNNALETAGLNKNFEKSNVTHTNDELLDMYISLCNKLGKAATAKDIDKNLEYSSAVFEIRFGGLNNLREMAGYEKYYRIYKYSKAGITNLLVKEYKKRNRRLTRKELTHLSNINDKFPSVTTICRHFKTTKMTDVWEEIERSRLV